MIKEMGIKFTKKGLTLEARYNRIHSETIYFEGDAESELINVLDTLYENKSLQSILEKLQIIYDEWFSNVE
jgi:hypothetical protein